MSETHFEENFDSCLYYTVLAEKEFQKETNHDGCLKAKNGILSLVLYNKNYKAIDSMVLELDSYVTKYSDILSPWIKSVTTNNLASIYLKKGNYNKAVKLFDFDIDNLNIHQINAGLQLAKTYAKLGDREKSLIIVEKILSKRIKEEKSFWLSLDLKIFGEIEQFFGNFEESNEIFEKALVNLEKVPQSNFVKKLRSKLELEILNNLVYLKEKNKIENWLIKNNQFSVPDRAAELKLLMCKAKYFNFTKMQDSLELYIEKIENYNIEVSNEENNLKEDLMFFEFSNYLAASNYEKILSNLKSKKFDQFSVNFKFKIVALLAKDQNLNKSVISQSELLLILGKLRKQINKYSYLKFWAHKNKETINDIIEGLTIGYTNSALILADENKSNILFDALINGQHTIESDIPDSIFYKRTSLISQITFQKKAKAETDSTNIEAIEYHESNIFNLEHKLKLLEDKYFKADEYFAFDTMHIEELQNNMAKDELIIEHFWADSLLYHFYINSDTIEVEVQNNAYLIDSLCTNYTEQIQQQKPAFNQTSKRMCSALFSAKSPFWNKDYKNITIIPDGPLTKIAFESLIDSTNQFLIQSKNISYQYSLKSKYILEKEKSHAVRDISAYGYSVNNKGLNFSRSCNSFEEASLICAETEKNNILELFNQSNQDKTINSKEEFITALSTEQIVHVATHACSDLEDPDMNRLFFDDGPLTSLELRDAAANAELVSISACHSGSGKLYLGEGSMSLSKDILSTGVKSTMVGLWTIDDCSSLQLTNSIYEYIKQGNTKDFAISQAKRDYLNTAHPDKIHPYYWSSLVLIGNTDALNIAPQTAWLYYIAGIVLLIGLGLFAFGKYQKPNKPAI